MIAHNHLLLLTPKAGDVVVVVVVVHLDELAGGHHGEVGEDGHVREVAVLQVGELAVLEDGGRDRRRSRQGLEGRLVGKVMFRFKVKVM